MPAMTRTCCGLLSVFAVLGVLVTSSAATADRLSAPGFRIACRAADAVDKDRAAVLCAEIIAAAQDRTGQRIEAAPTLPLDGGPGLEIVVEIATDTRLTLTPTWIDATGQRDVRPSVGIMTMDTTLTRSRRLTFFQRLLADLPR